MTDASREPELDLPAPSHRAAPRRKFRFAGLTSWQLAGIAALLAIVAWGMWVTRTLLTPSQERIVAVRLSGLVGEYVQAQARSASPPEQVEREMRAFMASLDDQMAKRAERGETVLVAEAVLTRNVPDVTDEVRRAVYTSGIAIPRPAQLPQGPTELEARQAAAGRPVGPGPAQTPATAIPVPSPFASPTDATVR
ncbi:type F conjugative transfer system protein TrbI [Hephaestia caeni]|uniref:Type F conjugative transfer system protein TrbI n=1 Tax=Hephaestia caeni TaxID=645617 RepID=A0A397PJE4_9SPHN|nr:type-F conjugative transfer system protein TrbI [Hephaestia caeni]RIA46274.1 type F conjugative transfer system protein TrbI [Hephaestia caeni]